ncbi:ankyrin repeat [Fusarium subglutinans]|uniref:Ankyrin repeat n=1 Tax=Gibberella subglutinans TaxID=42677 RepID=A0A8H5V075_GIBSU|nr:ankyrin repeat [Fusarium subglutinans]KAF5605987.1 ankyrin repeat [Fusarium subglutinans]
MAAQVLEEDCGYRLTELEPETGLISCHRSVGKAALASLFGHHRATEQFLEQEMPSEIEAETRLDDFVIEPPNVQYQPIFFSATVGHLISLHYILAKMGPSYQNARDQLGRTPLHQAARLGRYECLTSLADHFNIAEEDAHGWTAFDYLMHRINGLHDLEATRDTIRALIEARGERRDTRSPKGISLLSIAAKSPNETVLEKTCRPEMAGDIVNSRFFQIAYEGSLIKFLVDHGEDVNRQESIGRFAPLHFALYHNHIWNAMFLLRAGANVSTERSW